MAVPPITAIIPLYNGGAFIKEALESVFNQTLKPVKILVIDDGSADHGPDIVTSLAEQNDITLVRKQNGGQSSARNLGVSMTTTPLFALLDQDDIWYPHHLEELTKPFRAPRFPELGWVLSNLDEIDRDGRMVCRGCLDTAPTIQHPKRSLAGCLATDMFVLPSSSLIRRSAFEAVGGFDEALSGYEDDDLFLRMFRQGYDNVYLKDSLTKWRIYPTSSSHTHRMGRSRMIYIRKLFAAFPPDDVRRDHYIRDLLTPRFYHMLLHEYRLAIDTGDPERIRLTADDLRILVPHLPFRRRMVMRAAMPLMGHRMPSTMAARLIHTRLPGIGRLSRFILR